MLIDLQHIQKQYGGHAVLTDANLFMNENERVGLVGRNGSGKTTLLRIIVGSEEYDDGTFTVVKDFPSVIWSSFPTIPDEVVVRFCTLLLRK